MVRNILAPFLLLTLSFCNNSSLEVQPRSENDGHVATNDRLLSIVNNLKETVAAQSHQLKALATDLAELKATVAECRRPNGATEREKHGVAYESERSPEEGTNLIAFSAILSQDQTHNIGEVVIFDRVLYNNRDGYNSSTGEFTCLESGVYLFTLSVLNYNNLNLYVRLWKENVTLTTAFADFNQGYEQTSTTVIVWCTTWQRVWAQADAGQSPLTVNGDQQWYSSTFSGVKLS